ncbi:hypothetical protein C0Z18_28320 [Trinickia dabaoshanensis]|uniref:Uncharacterized protein n=1 Tax=Trinickia dabaoshanensis TaxID=564714 RepID=A0A2N7VDI8_9BURK|nr:hypothetical protein C0Z18_28320 [Trinickia dabaoshanensis]
MRQPSERVARYPTQMPHEAIRHWPSAAADRIVPRYETSTRVPADASAKLFDAAVNRKVDGTFTDLTH